MSRINETQHIKWHETCKCNCRLDASVCNNKQHWNKDKCRWVCKKWIDKERCDKGFILNPHNCDCECNKSCNVGEYLDYENCKCRKNLVNKLVERCSENTDGNEMIYNENLNDYENACKSCRTYIALLVIAFLIIIGISGAYFYFNWYLKTINTNVITNINANTETVVY